MAGDSYRLQGVAADAQYWPIQGVRRRGDRAQEVGPIVDVNVRNRAVRGGCNHSDSKIRGGKKRAGVSWESNAREHARRNRFESVETDIGARPIRVQGRIDVAAVNTRRSWQQAVVAVTGIDEHRVSPQITLTWPAFSEVAEGNRLVFLGPKIRVNRVRGQDDGIGNVDRDIPGCGVGLPRGANTPRDA